MNTHALKFAAQTHPGLKRKHNEDCFDSNPDLGLWLVADGVGGHSCGEVASDIVRATVMARVAAGDSLTQAIVASHQAVLQRIEQDTATAGMGSTVVVLQLGSNQYEIAWVGDSRAYLWDKQLEQLSVDHNRASELLANNVITPAQAAVHPERHVLTQSLGVSENITLDPGSVTGTLEPGQQIILCSDGLSDQVDAVVIAQIMAEHTTPEAQTAALMKAALDNGGSDNITVVIVGECAEPETASPDHDLETTRDTGRNLDGEDERNEGRSKFPFKALLAVVTLALVTILIII